MNEAESYEQLEHGFLRTDGRFATAFDDAMRKRFGVREAQLFGLALESVDGAVAAVDLGSVSDIRFTVREVSTYMTAFLHCPDLSL